MSLMELNKNLNGKVCNDYRFMLEQQNNQSFF